MIDRLTFLAGLVATGGLDIWATPSPAPNAIGGGTIRVLIADGSVQTLDLQRYLCGVVPLESPASWPAAALEAQAILARTYAIAHRTLSRTYDVRAGESDQRYGGGEAERPATTAAVLATRGRTLSYNGGPASVFYSACCGGRTTDAAVLWGHAGLAYLRSVEDPDCRAAPDYRWQRSIPAARVRDAFSDRVSGLASAALGELDPFGRPQAVLLAGTGPSASVTVSEFRRRLGSDVIRSLWLRRIDGDLREASSALVIEGSGRGHGVGLCQWGARGMALAGADVGAILRRYFPGTEVTGA